MEKVS